MPTTDPGIPPPAADAGTLGRGWSVLLLGLALAVGIAGFVGGITLHPDATTRLRDDAFYEFTWAANVARGVGPVVSDGVTTSGVQLLWSLLLVPFAWLLPVTALPLVAPWLGLLLHLLTAGLWYRALADRVTGLCVAACWAGHALLVRESQNGQETALACLCTTLLWLCRRTSERRFAVLAVLAVAARSDLFLLVLLLSLWRHRARWWRGLGCPALALALHVAANVALGGGPWPDSALPMAWLWHQNQAAADPAGTEWLARTWWFLRPMLLGGPFALASAFGWGFLVFLLLRPLWPRPLRALPALAVGCASVLGARDLLTVGWAALLLALLPRGRRKPLPKALLALAVGLAAIVVLHWAVRWYPRDYYLAPLVVAAVAAVARYGRLRLVLLLFVAAQGVDLGRVQPEPLGGQAAMELAGRWLGDAVPAGERVGSFNSGLVTFHAGPAAEPGRVRAVVNLDGVVDHRAFGALQRRGLAAWLDQQHICWLLDSPVQFDLDVRKDHACGRWFGADFAPERDLIEVARFVALEPAGGAEVPAMRLYWRVGHGERPALKRTARDLGVDAEGARIAVVPLLPGQRLVVAGDDSGSQRELFTSDAATLAWVRLPGPGASGRTLFVAGETTPLLRLPPR